MKIKKNIFLAIVFALISVANSWADEGDMPQPTKKSSGTAATNGIGVEEDFPIDQNLVFLMIAGLSLGTLMIYRNKIKKASM